MTLGVGLQPLEEVVLVVVVVVVVLVVLLLPLPLPLPLVLVLGLVLDELMLAVEVGWLELGV